jgi:LysM repeat protein
MKRTLLILLTLVIALSVFPVQPTAAQGNTYTVQPGDNLYRIALKFGTTVATIQQANNLKTTIIYVGQVLVIPGSGAPSSTAPQNTAANPGTYTVQRGDTLYRIARKFGVTVAAIQQANGLTTTVIHVGQKLAIPNGTGGTVTTAPPASTAAPSGGGQPGVNHLGTEKVVLADYVMWYDSSTFDGTKTWDVPSAGAYNSDDYGVIQRHVAQAGQACLNGFAAHWYGPTESRTTNNFNALLNASAGTGLRHAVVIQTNILPGATEQMIIDAINHVINNWAQSPNYLRLGGKPLLIFTDMPRPWGSDSAALAGWTRIRAATDPNHTMIWMAEGLYPTFNPLFDGLYVYRIDHRDYPQSWLKQKRWADGLRAVGKNLYFADTIAAGFDDTRSVNAPGDLRSNAPHFARDRRGGGYFADTFAATANTGGDFLFVKSFNEWIEGTEIEPGATYGDLYLNLTCQYANTYRSR